jgi:hypothetical protein
MGPPWVSAASQHEIPWQEPFLLPGDTPPSGNQQLNLWKCG